LVAAAARLIRQYHQLLLAWDFKAKRRCRLQHKISSAILKHEPLQCLTETLSGGMKRKLSAHTPILNLNLKSYSKPQLGLGIAYLGESKLVILDEPTAGVMQHNPPPPHHHHRYHRHHHHRRNGPCFATIHLGHHSARKTRYETRRTSHVTSLTSHVTRRRARHIAHVALYGRS
jgi:hypothetical protein